MEKKNINEVIANLSVEQLAGMIDHTFLKPFGTAENIEKLCAEARQYKFAMVAINPAEVETCVKLLEGSGTEYRRVQGIRNPRCHCQGSYRN